MSNLKKKAISFLHDVGFVDCRYSVSAMGLGIVKGIFSHPKTCLTSYNLQTFNHTSHHLTPDKRTPSVNILKELHLLAFVR